MSAQSDRGIPPDWRARSPLLDEAGWANLRRLRERPDAPRWNFETGDRLEPGDLETVEAFREQARDGVGAASRRHLPPVEMLAWIRAARNRSWLFESRLAPRLDLERDWATVPTMDREDLACRLAEVVPWDLDDFSRLLVYDTSGTTGHAVAVPHDPLTLARAQALAEVALARHGAAPRFDATTLGCLNLCAQARTYVFATVFTVWNQTGFVKVNLNPRDWAGGPEAARSYLEQTAAQLVTSDPISLVEAERWQIGLRPAAILSTAVELAPALRERLAARFRCPVIDWYSTTETGPIACSSPRGDGLEILPHDLFVEVVDESGVPLPDGELGEICVTSGRNPFLPLLRYRTGDFGRLSREPIPRLLELHGRTPVSFRDADGGAVSSVDIGRAIRLVAQLERHRFLQRADGSCELRVRPLSGVPIDETSVRAAIRSALGAIDLDLVLDPDLGRDGKSAPYVSELSP